MGLEKKILIFIPQDLFARNYISTDSFKALNSSHQLQLIVSESVTNTQDIESCNINFEYYKEDNSRNHLLYYILDLLMWRYRKRSSTFNFRLNRYQGLKFTFPKETKLIEKFLLVPWRIIRFIYLRARNYLLGSSPLFYIYYSLFKIYLGLNKGLEKQVLNYDPDLILFPSSAYDPIGYDLIDICKKNNITSFFLIDNWDNLSSKSIFFDKPDFIGVWGEQSKQHAVEIQSFKKNQIKLLGTPRFDQYFEYRKSKLDSPYDFPYILFVGTALKFDESACILKLDHILSNNKHLQNFKIIYRPHPWRHNIERIDINPLKNIIIDSQLESAYSAGINSTSIQPRLSYYPSLLSNAEIILGGLTSMLIEATIFHKPFIGMIHDDKKNYTSMHNVYKSYIHFEGIDNIDSIYLCDHLDKLESKINEAISLKPEIDKSIIDQQRAYFYFNDNLNYSTRLANACKEILEI